MTRKSALPTNPTVHGTRPNDRLLTITEVAERLGVDVRHMRRLVHERRIPYIKWGHLLRFDPADIDRWIDANRHDAVRRLNV